MNIAIGLLIPFIGTLLGASTVFLLKNGLKDNVQKLLLGFASGVMIAASVWSLIIPSLNMAAEQGKIEWMPAAIGFLLGIFFLLLIDMITPHLHAASGKTEGPKAQISKTTMLMLAVTIHNIPEGMAVGVVYAGIISGNVNVSLAAALALSTGIAIQNFPEGAVISMPLAKARGKLRAFGNGVFSGIVEPLAAFITILLSQIVTPLLPYFLSFAAGAMIYVVIEDLIPEAQEGEHSNLCTIGAALGFVLMMILDVALG